MTIASFKSNAWATGSAATAYHVGTVQASALFQFVRGELFLKYIQEVAPPPAKVLDLGCGTGLVSNALHDLGYSVVACDVSASMLSKLKHERHDRIFEVRQGDGFLIPGANAEFDLVVSRMFIQHFPEWPRILKEKARVTRAGGIVLFDFANREHIAAVKDGFGAADDFPYCDDPNVDPAKFYASATQEQMIMAITAAGLEIVEIRPHGLLLNNAFLWRSLKSSGIAALNEKLNELFKHQNARDLMQLIEEQILPHLPVSTTYGNIVIARRSSVS